VTSIGWADALALQGAQPSDQYVRPVHGIWRNSRPVAARLGLLCVQAFTVTVEESQTGAALKSAIHSAKGEAFEPSLLKVVHAGKILKDDDVLGTAGVKDGGFVVCMVSKPKVRACIAVQSVGVGPSSTIGADIAAPHRVSPC